MTESPPWKPADPALAAPPASPAAPVTTTTVATVTTTTTPSAGAIPWYQSQRFITLCQSTALWVLSWLVAALSSNDWAWRAVAIGVSTNILIALKDWWSPSIIAPFAALNQNNVPAKVDPVTK